MAQFISLTQSSEKHAINFLSQYDWKLDVATDAYYNSLDTSYLSVGGGHHHNTSSSGSGRNSNRDSNSKITIDKKKLDQIWTLYKDTTIKEEKLTSEGVCRFLQDLHFRIDDRIVLILAWKFKAQVQGEFTKEEFYNGMHDLG